MKQALLAITAILMVPGCIVVRDPYRGTGPRHVVVDDDDNYRVSPNGTVWVAERGHIHSDHCGHFWHNGTWYASRGHVHGPSCGHSYVEGVWVHAGLVTIKTGHVHSDHCGHFNHGGSWYYMHNHKHGPGCGHTHRNGVWIAVRF
jgi:hypothetical protein